MTFATDKNTGLIIPEKILDEIYAKKNPIGFAAPKEKK